MLELSQVATIAKNSLSDDSPWILLFKIITPEGVIIRICNDLEDFNYDGHTWIAFPVKIADFNEEKKESVEELKLQFANVNGLLDSYLERYNGLAGSEVNIICLYAKTGNVTEAYSISLEISKTVPSGDWVECELTNINPYSVKLPRATLRKRICRYKKFKGSRCGYTGSETSCDRTLKQCKQYGNVKNFGGSLMLGWDGIYH